jgi:hypothetical protein
MSTANNTFGKFNFGIKHYFICEKSSFQIFNILKCENLEFWIFLVFEIFGICFSEIFIVKI